MINFGASGLEAYELIGFLDELRGYELKVRGGTIRYYFINPIERF